MSWAARGRARLPAAIHARAGVELTVFLGGSSDRDDGQEISGLAFTGDGEVHDLLLHRHWLEAYRAAADFFDRRLKRN